MIEQSGGCWNTVASFNDYVFLISGATLLFDVELINISDSPPSTNVFKEIDTDHDNQLSREEVRAMARSFSIFFSEGRFR